MPRDGSGKYVIPASSWYPPVNGQDAQPDDFQRLIEDIATAISQSFAVDGQTPIQSNLNMNGYRINNLGDPLVDKDAVNRAFLSKGQSISISSTLTLPRSGSMFDVLGSGEVNEIKTSYQGRQVWLRFESGATIKNTDDLLMPGNNDYVTFDGEIGHFIEIESGVWLCTQIGRPAVVGTESWQVPTNETAQDQLAGMLAFFAMNDSPDGWLKCDGSEVLKADYPRLYSRIGDIWGAASDSDKFKLPDAEQGNRFMRAAGGSLNVGDLQADQIKAHNHTASTDNVGGHTHTVASAGNHSHSYYTGRGEKTTNSGYPANAEHSQRVQTLSTNAAGAHTHSMDTAGAHSHTVTVGNTGGAETRPNSMVGLLCIKY